MNSVSKNIIESVELKISVLEDQFGHANLQQLISKVDAYKLAGHIDNYRSIVRQNDWKHKAKPWSNFQGFLLGFSESAITYAETGFESFRYLKNPQNLKLATVHKHVLASEALRGQWGKSSPQGLDIRLMQLEDQIDEILTQSGMHNSNDTLIILGTLPSDCPIAETDLLESFHVVKQIFPLPPTTDDLLNASSQEYQVVWKFLRRHCWWSLDKLKAIYENYAFDLQPSIHKTRLIKREFDQKRKDTIVSLQRELPKDTFSKVVQASESLLILNHLNLLLEPMFSFKGGVGLGHGLIFDLVESMFPSIPLFQRQLVLETL